MVERCYYMAEVGGSIPTPAYHVRFRVVRRREAVHSPRYSSFVIEMIDANMTAQPNADSPIQVAKAAAGETTCVSPVGSSSPVNTSPTYARLGWGNWFGIP